MNGRRSALAILAALIGAPLSASEGHAQGDLLRADLGDRGVLVVRTLDNGVRAYLVETTTHFKKGPVPGEYADKATGSIWDLDRGICVRGKRKGEHLEPLSVTAAFWFAWSTFYPNTGIAP